MPRQDKCTSDMLETYSTIYINVLCLIDQTAQKTTNITRMTGF